MTHVAPTRFARLVLTLSAALLVACGYSGSPSGSGSGFGGTTALSEPITADLAWAASSGPVDGYRVFESRDGGPFMATQDVGTSQATVTGEDGETLRIQVAGLDAMGNPGPASDPSDLLRFQGDGVVVDSSASAAASLGSGGGASMRQVEGSSSLGAGSAGSGGGSAQGSDSGSLASSQADDGKLPEEVLDPVRADMDGDGATDLLWESASAGLLRVTTADLALLASFERPPAEWGLVGLADLDGDGLTDLLWARDSGELALSSMAGSLESQPTLGFVPAGSLADGDLVAATGDFDGDGKAELLVEDSLSGELSFGGVAPGSSFEPQLLNRALAAGEAVAGSNDYDGNGFDDVLLQASDGSLALWLMGPGAGSEASIAALPAGDVLASGDFDGDGVSDIARSTLVGEVEVLLLGAGAASPGSVTGFPAAPAVAAAGAGDYDADGVADLLWQAAEASPVVWYLETNLPQVDALGLVAEPDWVLVPDWR